MSDKDKADIASLHRTIDAMADAIGPLVAEHLESEAAHAKKLEAQVILVTKILDLAKPTVRALGTRPLISESQATYVGGSPITERANWRGLVLTSPVKQIKPYNEPGPTAITTAAEATEKGFARGSYTGSQVFMREDGSLVKLSYEGSWNAIQGGYDKWSATEGEISIETFCRDCPFGADPKKLAEQLLGFMNTVGDRRKATVKARDLAAKFHAITTLL